MPYSGALWRPDLAHARGRGCPACVGTARSGAARLHWTSRAGAVFVQPRDAHLACAPKTRLLAPAQRDFGAAREASVLILSGRAKIATKGQRQPHHQTQCGHTNQIRKKGIHRHGSKHLVCAHYSSSGTHGTHWFPWPQRGVCAHTARLGKFQVAHRSSTSVRLGLARSGSVHAASNLLTLAP